MWYVLWKGRHDDERVTLNHSTTPARTKSPPRSGLSVPPNRKLSAGMITVTNCQAL
jgi:hypothetical protein